MDTNVILYIVGGLGTIVTGIISFFIKRLINDLDSVVKKLSENISKTEMNAADIIKIQMELKDKVSKEVLDLKLSNILTMLHAIADKLDKK